MTVMNKPCSRAAAPLASLAVFFASVLAASAGQLTVQDVVAKLKPAAARSAPGNDLTARDIIAKLRPPLTRSVAGRSCTRGMRAVVRSAEDTLGQRTVELTVPFEYNSDRISPEAASLLDQVGQALTDEQLGCHDFMLAGHTDARGGEEYNLSLSERRALAVRAYLSEKFGIPARRLETRGFGKERLFDPQDPAAAVNRRVEIVNLTSAR